MLKIKNYSNLIIILIFSIILLFIFNIVTDKKNALASVKNGKYNVKFTTKSTRFFND